MSVLRGGSVVGRVVRFVYFRIVAPLRRALWQTILSSAGGRLDHGAMLYEGTRIVQGHPGSIRIGKDLRMLRNATINTLPPSGQIVIGDGVHIGEGTMITAHSRVEIEDDAVIGPYNVIVDVDHVCEDRSRPIAKQGLDSRPIRIGRGAWISSHCVILKGVTIGRGAVLGAGTFKLIIAIGLTITPRFARIAYGPTLSVKEKEFVEAARALGQRTQVILSRHILPNVAGELLVLASLWTAQAIRLEASLSFIGLGVPPPTPTWGQMISEGSRYLTDFPLLSLAPGLALLFTVFAFNLVGDGLRDVLDPRSR